MSVLISTLPVYTGTAADLRWFVMNNSGETETYKFSGYTSPFRKGDGNNTSISNYYNTDTAPLNNTCIIGGTGNTMAATSSYTDGYSNSIFGGTGNIMDLNGPQPGQNYGHTIIGGNYNTLRFRANAAVNTMVGGQSNVMDCFYGGNTIIGGNNNTSQGSSNNTIIGAQVSTITGGDRNGIWGGYSQSVGGNYDNNIYGGFDNTISAGGFNTIVGGSTNGITASNDSNSIVGGSQNTISASQLNSGMFGVFNSNIYGLGSYNGLLGGATNGLLNNIGSVILGGSGCLISGNTSPGVDINNSIISSRSATIPGGLSHVSMIGATSGRTATASATTYVENLHTYRTPSTQVQPISSGTTFTCNLELGAKSQFYITGTSTINITNVRDGASFMIKTQTDGNYVMTWTATGGYTFVFEGGLKDPGNTTTDLFVFEVFGSVIYGSRRHNFS